MIRRRIGIRTGAISPQGSALSDRRRQKTAKVIGACVATPSLSLGRDSAEERAHCGADLCGVAFQREAPGL
jgi:hypothetical protein